MNSEGSLQMLLSILCIAQGMAFLTSQGQPECDSNFDFKEKMLVKMVKTSHDFGVFEEKVSEEIKGMKAKLVKSLAEHDARIREVEKRDVGSTAAPCPDGWVIYKDSCYFFDPSTMNFAAAKRFCKSVDSKLVEIETPDEDAFIRSLLRRVKGDKFWIGITDEEDEGDWVRADSMERLTYKNWGKSQPNNGRVSNCGAIWESFMYNWVDEPCTNKFRPVCEKPSRTCQLIGAV